MSTVQPNLNPPNPLAPPSQADTFAAQEAQLADDKRRLRQHVREKEASTEELIRQFRCVCVVVVGWGGGTRGVHVCWGVIVWGGTACACGD